MIFRALSVVTLLSMLLVFGLQTPISAEDWSIRKINPFGSRSAKEKASGEGNPQAKDLETDKQAEDEDDARSRPLTALEIRKSFSRIGQETAAAFTKTRNVLTPDFNWPKWDSLGIKFRRSVPTSGPEKTATTDAASVKK